MNALDIIDMNKDFLRIEVKRGIVESIRTKWLDFKWKAKATQVVSQVHMAHHEDLLQYADGFNMTRTNIIWMLKYQRIMNDWLLEIPDVMSPSGKYILQLHVDAHGVIEPVFEETNQLY